MNIVWELWMLILRTFPVLLTDSRYVFIIVLVLMIVHGQYSRIHAYEKRMFGLSRGTPFKDTMTGLLIGLAGGLIGTFLFIALGISLPETGIAYLWLTAILLMLIHPRFLCFSYAGGIISVSYLIFGFPKVDVPAIMALVAILHLVESFLIVVHGHYKASPMYLKHASGRVVGGFTMQKFWPLPFIALLALVMAESGIDFDSIAMPDWWPLIRPDGPVPSGHTIVYILFPVIAALGYSDVAMTSLPKTKVKRSAFHLSLFSLVLLSLAFVADRFPITAIVAALFSPLGHEWVIYLGQRQEKDEPPVFTTDDGVMVLDVYPDSPAEKMGLRPGDIIRSMNGIPVHSLPELLGEMTPWVIDPEFVVENALEGNSSRKVAFKGKIPPLGVIPTPDPRQPVYVQMKQGFLQTWWNKLRNKRK